jgi:hypothetical protein
MSGDCNPLLNVQKGNITCEEVYAFILFHVIVIVKSMTRNFKSTCIKIEDKNYFRYCMRSFLIFNLLVIVKQVSRQ